MTDCDPINQVTDRTAKFQANGKSHPPVVTRQAAVENKNKDHNDQRQEGENHAHPLKKAKCYAGIVPMHNSSVWHKPCPGRPDFTVCQILPDQVLGKLIQRNDCCRQDQ